MTEKIRHISIFCFIALAFSIFQIFYFNKFLPIQDGWFIEYAKQLSSGKLIYKDFYVFIQPIYVYIFSWISDLFGNSFIVFRYYGLAERVLLIAVSYLLFAQITNAFRAAFSVLLGVFLFVTCSADVIYSYYQIVVIFVFLSAYFLIIFYRQECLKAVFVAGIFSGLAFMTKQSTGTLVPVALLLTIGILKVTDTNVPPRRVKAAFFFVCGFLLPVIITLGYLWHLGVISFYWDQVFVATTSKGKLSHVLFSFWGNLLSLKQFFQMSLFFAFFYGLHKFALMKKASPSNLSYFFENHKRIWMSLGFTLLFLASITPWFVDYPGNFSSINFIYTSVNFFEMEFLLAFICLYFNGMLVIYCFYRAVTKSLRQEEIPLAVISVTSFAFMWGHGLSGFIEPHAIVIGAGLLFIWLLNTKIPFNLLKNAVVYSLVIFIIAMCAFAKASWMYSWWGWDERIAWTANKEPDAPLLKGFRLNTDKAEIINGLTKAIQRNSNEGDPIFIFPHMPMFYLLANRHHDTFSAVHYFDVCSDELAKSDAKIVASTKPKVIINMDIPESVWTFNEVTYRGGSRSGQRNIKEFIERVKRTGEYKVVQNYTTSGYQYDIQVLVRNEDARTEKYH